MLKDVVVNLSGRGRRDFAAEYATSIAAAFGAHITGISFVYEPVIPDGTLGGVPARLPMTRSAGSMRRRKRREFPRQHAFSTRPSAVPPPGSARLRAASILPSLPRRSAKAEHRMIS